MKTTTATSGTNVTSLHSGPGKLARAGFTALALTAMGMGLFGAGSASADEPRRLGQPVDAQIAQNVQVKQVQPVGSSNFGKVSSTVTRVTAGATGQGATQQQCDGYAKGINNILALKQEAANNQDQYLAEAYDDVAESAIDSAMDAGCFIVY
jgi:hypothetical protein